MFGQGEEGDGLILLGMGRRGLTMVAGLLAITGLVAATFYYIGQPRTLRLAVGPLGSDDARMAAAFVQGLSREKKPIRLRLVLTEGSAESARKIDAGEVDLAIVRPDIALPAKADTGKPSTNRSITSTRMNAKAPRNRARYSGVSV